MGKFDQEFDAVVRNAAVDKRLDKTPVPTEDNAASTTVKEVRNG